jgi:F-type H+-transporting ATPase subunit b
MLTVPALAFAAEAAEYGGSESSSPVDTILNSPIMPKMADFIPMILAMCIILFIMNKYVWPPIMKALDEREQKIEDSLKRAEDAKLEAEEILAQYRAKIAEGEREVASMIDEGRQAGEVARAEVIARAEDQAAVIIKKAQADADNKERVVAASLQKKVADLAISIATKIVGDELGDGEKAQATQLASEIGG